MYNRQTVRKKDRKSANWPNDESLIYEDDITGKNSWVINQIVIKGYTHDRLTEWVTKQKT